jgi:membrane-bound metal-dependent hydrolase YbcI (DUF457 family)
MYIGHVGAALAAKRVRASIGLLPLLIATYAPDWIDTGMCVTRSYDARGMLSHSIPAVLSLALVGYVAYAAVSRDWTGGLVIAAVIISHVLLDWITGYKPTWPGGPMIGLRLYDHPIADFVTESVVIGIGAVLYARTLPRQRRAWVDASIMAGALLVLQLTIDVAHLLMPSLAKC